MKIKLYTQEQVLDAIEKSEIGYSGSQIIESLTPIELPSDEEIEKSNPFRIDGGAYNSSAAYQWSNGAQWMRDKIQGGNK